MRSAELMPPAAALMPANIEPIEAISFYGILEFGKQIRSLALASLRNLKCELLQMLSRSPSHSRTTHHRDDGPGKTNRGAPAVAVGGWV
jgi:hypothetical protein